MIPHDPRTLHRQLAELAAVEVSVRTALQRLQSVYPPIPQRHDDNEVREISTARVLVDLCNDLLVALNDHRSLLVTRLRALQSPEQTAWPF